MDKSTISIDIDVPLVEKHSRIALISKNKYSQSTPEIINVTYEPQSTRVEDLYKPDLYLLAIGVSEYQDSSYNLDTTHLDALALSTLLQGQRGKLYKNVFSKTLVNQDANRDNILDGLDWLLKETTQRDTAVIFVAGHGMKDTREN